MTSSYELFSVPSYFLCSYFIHGPILIYLACRWDPKGYYHSGAEWTREFALVSLFNGISTFVGYLMPKLSFLEEK